MNKLEEKLEEAITSYSINSGVVSKCVEITEQECIGFKKFCETTPISGSDERLFQLYLKSKENE